MATRQVPGRVARILAPFLSACAVSWLGGCGKRAGGRAEKLKPPQLFSARCSQCHGLEPVLEKTDYTAAHWRSVVENMMTSQGAAGKISIEEAEEIKSFLADPAWRTKLSKDEGGRADERD